jgi:hypothetical protein
MNNMSYKIGYRRADEEGTCPGLVEMEEQITRLQQIISELLRENKTLVLFCERLAHQYDSPFRRDYVDLFMWLRQEGA